MRRLCRALALFFRSCLTWRTCWRHARDEPRFHIVERDGYRYVEPKPLGRNRLGKVPSPMSWPPAPGPRIVVEGRVPQDVQ